MKKIVGSLFILIGALIGVPSVFLCLTIIGLPFGVPLVLGSATLLLLGLKMVGLVRNNWSWGNVHPRLAKR